MQAQGSLVECATTSATVAERFKTYASMRSFHPQVGTPWNEGSGMYGSALNFSVRNLGGCPFPPWAFSPMGCFPVGGKDPFPPSQCHCPAFTDAASLRVITRIALRGCCLLYHSKFHMLPADTASQFVINDIDWKQHLAPAPLFRVIQHSRERHLDIFTSSTLSHVSCAGKAPVAVPWQLSVASQAYAGIANSWSCGATYEASRHTLHGAALSNSCAAAMCAVPATGPVFCVHARFLGFCRRDPLPHGLWPR